MARQSAPRPSNPVKTGQQPSLTSFFKPKNSFAMEVSAPVGKAAQGPPMRFDDSSSEDELASLDSIIKPRQAGRTTPKRRGGTRLSPSPPSKVPVTSGAFNLQALLEDRTTRLAQKATIERLEANRSRQDSPIAKSGSFISDRVQQLLTNDKQEVDLYWSSVGKIQPLQRPLVPRELKARLPKVLLNHKDEIAHIDELCFWLQLRTQQLSPGWIRYLLTLLRSSDNENDVQMITSVLEEAKVPIEALMASMTQLMGLEDEQTLKQMCQTDCCTQTAPIPADPVHKLKLRAMLSLLKQFVQSTEHGTIKTSHLCVLVRFLTLLHLDHSYGRPLAPQLAELHHTINAKTSRDVLLAVYMSLLDVTTSRHYQAQILESLPTKNDDCISRLQIMAAIYFLSLKEPEDQHKLESTDHRLEAIVTFLQSESPFHPIDNETSYEEIKQRISLLSLTTMHIHASHGFLTQQLIENLQALHGQIIDSKAAFIVRSEAKAAIQRLSDRLKYTLAAQGRKHSVFEHFS